MATLSLFIVALLTVVTAQQRPTPDFQEYLNKNIAFTAEVYQQLLQQQRTPENFVVCPTSAQLVLALTKYGARGNTATELARAIGVPERNDKLINVVENLTYHLQGNDKYALHLASKIYVKKDLHLSEAFKVSAKNYFNSRAESINFVTAANAAATMNQWVYQKTNGKINNLIDPSYLNNRTALVLLNAIYFKGKWVYDFDDHFTKPRQFQINRHTNVSTLMMQMTTHLNYYKSQELKAEFVELPYEGNGVTMTIVLPEQIDGLQNLEQNLEQVFSAQPYTEEDVHVRLPKFNISTTIDFATILKNLEVRDAFDDRRADFSGMSENGQPIKIDQVVQKAVIELDEKGTTATAATYTLAAIPISAAFVPPPLPVFFEVNRPFIYYLKSPAGILFAGRYVK